jgi:hypothetical protein
VPWCCGIRWCIDANIDLDTSYEWTDASQGGNRDHVILGNYTMKLKANMSRTQLYCQQIVSSIKAAEEIFPNECILLGSIGLAPYSINYFFICPKMLTGVLHINRLRSKYRFMLELQHKINQINDSKTRYTVDSLNIYTAAPHAYTMVNTKTFLLITNELIILYTRYIFW